MSPPPPPIKFLLVDDLEANLMALEGLLRRDGLELLKATSGEAALELLLLHDVALAFLDVQMPGMDGFELAELMRGTDRTRHVPIIFLTAGGPDHQRHFRGYEAGAVDFLFKPLDPHVLKSKAQIFYDLAAQRAALRRTAEEAQAANRAKDDFLAALSHELRTPLNPVLLSAAALQEDPRLPDDIREQLAMMERNIALEARLIDDLLDLTKIANGKLTLDPCVTDLHDLLRQTERVVRGTAQGKDVALDFGLSAPQHHAFGDPARLQQVFWNILNNAVKFSRKGGRVRVETHGGSTGRIVISFQDQGAGISPEALPAIFNAFDQGGRDPRQFGGLGLGLAISKSIVELHQGTITAHSAGPGKGAVFTITLQLCAGPAAGPDPAKISPVQKLRVLLVDDHEATLDAFARVLIRDGHEVTASGTVHDALTAAEHQRFDVLISDLGLPDGTGYDLMRKLRQHRLHPEVPGIILSGYGTVEDERRSLAAGFFAHLVKPVRVEQIRRELSRIPSPPPGRP